MAARACCLLPAMAGRRSSLRAGALAPESCREALGRMLAGACRHPGACLLEFGLRVELELELVELAEPEELELDELEELLTCSQSWAGDHPASSSSA